MINQFSTVKRGYNPEEVESYIANLERIIEEYKEKDSSITKAIVNAQVAADNIIKNAELASDEIREQTVANLDNIYKSIEKQKEIVKDFQGQYNDLVNKYLKDVQTTDFLEIFSSINELENYMASLKKLDKTDKEKLRKEKNKKEEM